jgi:cell filamentation protein
MPVWSMRSWEDYFIPGTDTLLNKFGETDPVALQALEEKTVALRMAHLLAHPILGLFDFTHLCSIHRRLFQDVYYWAGQPRTAPWDERMTKSAPDVVNYPVGDPAAPMVAYGYYPARFIPEASRQVFRQLADENHLQGLDRDTFADRLADFWNEVNVIHAFREGNTRTQSVFFSQLADRAGHPLNVALFAVDGTLRDEFVAARFHSQATGSHERLRGVLAAALD